MALFFALWNNETMAGPSHSQRSEGTPVVRHLLEVLPFWRWRLKNFGAKSTRRESLLKSLPWKRQTLWDFMVQVMGLLFKSPSLVHNCLVFLGMFCHFNHFNPSHYSHLLCSRTVSYRICFAHWPWRFFANGPGWRVARARALLSEWQTKRTDWTELKTQGTAGRNRFQTQNLQNRRISPMANMKHSKESWTW